MNALEQLLFVAVRMGLSGDWPRGVTVRVRTKQAEERESMKTKPEKTQKLRLKRVSSTSCSVVKV